MLTTSLGALLVKVQAMNCPVSVGAGGGSVKLNDCVLPDATTRLFWPWSTHWYVVV